MILSNCTRSRNFSRRLYGNSILHPNLKTGNYGGLQCKIRIGFTLFSVFGHAPQTFWWEVSKNIWGENVSGRMDIASSKLFHGRLSAFGTQADVKVPDCL